jgi:hypothetical protein
MTESICLFKRQTRSLGVAQFEALTHQLRIDGKPLVTDEALCCSDGTRTLAYAQPCARFASLLFFTDQSVAWGEASGKTIPAKRAKDWTEKLLETFELLPRRVDDERIRFELELDAQETDAVVFDGKERRRIKAKTDVFSRAKLNGIEVVGPRAKARLVFKAAELPVMLHVGLWESLSVYEERERVREHDVARTVAERLTERGRCEGRSYRLCDIRLVYMAEEFRGAPDLLVPEYLVEIELRGDRHQEKNAPIPPRQVLRVPAYR